MLRVAGIVTWIVWPSYGGLMLGALLWATHDASASGSWEALIYDEMAALGLEEGYPRLMARIDQTTFVGTAVSAGLATGLLAVGGTLAQLGWMTAVTAALAVPLVLRLPTAVHQLDDDGESGLAGWWQTLRRGIGAARRDPGVRRLLILGALIEGIFVFDEYAPLLARLRGADDALVAVFVGAIWVALFVGSEIAARRPNARAPLLGSSLALAGGSLVAAMLTPWLVGVLAMALVYLALQANWVIAEARLQAVLDSSTRATVSSVRGFVAALISAAIFVEVGQLSVGPETIPVAVSRGRPAWSWWPGCWCSCGCRGAAATSRTGESSAAGSTTKVLKRWAKDPARMLTGRAGRPSTRPALDNRRGRLRSPRIMRIQPLTVLAGGLCCLLASGCFSDDGDSSVPPLGTGGSGGDDAGDAGDAGDSGADDDGPTTDVPGAEGPTAELRIVHASPDAGPVDIYAAGTTTPLFSDLTYGDATEWSEVDAVPLSFEVRVAGSDPAGEPLYADTLDLVEGERVNAIAAGLVDGETASKFHVLPVVEGWGNDVAGRARVRFVHAGPDLPSVAFEGAGSQASELEPFSSSAAEGATIDIDGGVRLQVLPAGGGDDQLTSFTSPELAEGDDVLLVATGLAASLGREPDGLRLLAIGANGPLEPILQDPQLFVLHGSGDSDSLELCSGTQEVAANFTYGEIVPTRVAPGSYNLQIFNYPAGCTGTALNGSGNASSFEAGERYLMLLTGEQTADAGEASIQAAPFRDEFTLDDEQNARVRFVHGASYSQIYVGSVTSGTIEAPNVFTQPIAWRSASVETTVPTGPVLLGIADAVGEPPPPYLPIVTFDYAAQGGERQWGIVAGDPSPDDNDDRSLQLLLVDSAPVDWTVSINDTN